MPHVFLWVKQFMTDLRKTKERVACRAEIACGRALSFYYVYGQAIAIKQSGLSHGKVIPFMEK